MRTARGWLLADHVERTADGLRVERRGETRHLSASEVENLTATGVADRWRYPLGSDKFSRDVLSRLLWGARLSLAIGSLSVMLAIVIGVPLGALAGLGRPWIDALLMRLVDGLLAFPTFFLVIVVAALLPRGELSLVAILGGTGWMGIARLTRAEMKSLGGRDFVVAVRGLGAGPVHVFLRHLLPNALTPILVAATLQVGVIVLIEASLSFLGFGIAPPTASWGNMIADSERLLTSAWWTAVVPGVTLVVTVIAINLLGDGLRDALDPRGEMASRTPRRLLAPPA